MHRLQFSSAISDLKLKTKHQKQKRAKKEKIENFVREKLN